MYSVYCIASNAWYGMNLNLLMGFRHLWFRPR